MIIFVFTELFVFMINYEFESRVSFNSIDIYKESIRTQLLKKIEIEMIEKIKKIMKFIRSNLQKTQNN